VANTYAGQWALVVGSDAYPLVSLDGCQRSFEDSPGSGTGAGERTVVYQPCLIRFGTTINGNLRDWLQDALAFHSSAVRTDVTFVSVDPDHPAAFHLTHALLDSFTVEAHRVGAKTFLAASIAMDARTDVKPPTVSMPDEPMPVYDTRAVGGDLDPALNPAQSLGALRIRFPFAPTTTGFNLGIPVVSSGDAAFVDQGGRPTPLLDAMRLWEADAVSNSEDQMRTLTIFLDSPIGGGGLLGPAVTLRFNATLPPRGVVLTGLEPARRVADDLYHWQFDPAQVPTLA
jgi:hypothetical protein